METSKDVSALKRQDVGTDDEPRSIADRMSSFYNAEYESS
jgi:hypothetical protein